SSRRLAGLTLALGLLISGVAGTAGAQEAPPPGDQEPVVEEPLAPTGTITVSKRAQPQRYEDFRFVLGGDFGSGVDRSFMLDDDNGSALPNSRTFTDLGRGTYVITEVDHEGWALRDVQCSGGTVVRDGRAITITITAAAETVTCTFFNDLIRPGTIDVPTVQAGPETQPGQGVNEGTPTLPGGAAAVEGSTTVQGDAAPFGPEAPGKVAQAARDLKELPRTS
ncbi:MAG: prealbumin-like fold domain-containing protein, partial [Actinomycetota bacterium]